METRSPAPLILTLLAALAVFYPATVASHGAAKENASTKLLPDAKSPSEDSGGAHFPTAKDLVREYVVSSEGNNPASAAATAPYTIDFLFATVPDPDGSRLPHFFDSFVDSLMSAAEAAGFAPDRYALPWSMKGFASPRAAQLWAPALDESHPGLILFRKPQQQQLLLFFLIGETPTSGIHKAALFSALDQAAQFYRWDPRHGDLPAGFPHAADTGGADTFRLMAPSFSGSAISLRDVLDGWVRLRRENPNVRFEIISGTATAIDAACLFQGGRGGATFQAAVPPDNQTLPAAICYIQELGNAKVAILTEGNTAYGQHVKQLSEQSAGRDGSACASAEPPPKILTLPFPLHISRLRASTEKATAHAIADGQASSDGKSSGSSHDSPLTSEEPMEVLPSFSEVSVASAELMLSNLLSTIARERYTYVGIVATDVRDATFLAKQVRLHCPATVLFVFNADLLYSYPEVNSFTRGMMVFTPYPLFNLAQIWTFGYQGADNRLQFSSGAAEGVYNATLALLGEDDKLVDYGEPLAFGARASASSVHKPSLWVTAVGNRETVPVTLLPLRDVDHYTYGARDRSIGRSGSFNVVSGIYTEDSLVQVIAVSLIFLVIAALVLIEYRRRRWLKSVRVPQLIGDTASSAYCSECRLFLFAGCASMLALYLVIASDFCLPIFAARELGERAQTGFLVKVATGLVIVTFLLLVAATHTLVRAFFAAPPEERGSAPEVVLFVFVACLFVLLLAALYVNRQFAAVRLYPAGGLFDYLRAFDLRGGLSPILPLLCVAVGAVLWAVSSYRRLRLLDVLRASGDAASANSWLTFLPLDPPSLHGVRELEASLKHVLESSSVVSLRAYLGLGALALMGGFYFFGFPLTQHIPGRLVRALEPHSFYWLFAASFFIVYWALFMEFVRLIVAWRSLHALLMRLSWHPMLAAYKRYRECFPVLSKMNLTSPPSRFALLESSVHQASQLLIRARALAQSSATDASLAAALQQATPAWEVELKQAEAEMAEALRLEWSSSPQTPISLTPDPTRKRRAKPVHGNYRMSLECQHRAHRALTKFLAALGKPLERHWRPHDSQDGPCAPAADVKDFFDHAEEFFVGRVVNLLGLVFPPLQNLGYFVLGGLLLMLLAVTSYPFQPRNEFLFFNWVVILSFVGMVLWIIIQMDRDTVLSLLNGTPPGQISINREILFRLLLYVVTPVLALLGAQFPEGLQKILSLFAGAPGGAG